MVRGGDGAGQAGEQGKQQHREDFSLAL